MKKDYEICVNDNNVFVDVEFKEYPSKNIYYFANANLFIYKLVDNEILELNNTIERLNEEIDDMREVDK